jgi:hypothetical protein
MSARLAIATAETAAPVRSDTELATSMRAVPALIASMDPRCRLLGRGARYVTQIFTDGAADHPLGSEPGPALADVPSAIERAGRAAVGELPWHKSVPGDAGRLMGRGAEEWLVWAFLTRYPLPLWLVPGMPSTEICHCVLGDVGAELPQPSVTSGRFTYDVVDQVEHGQLAMP